MSDMELSESDTSVSLVKFSKAEMSDMELLSRSRCARLIAYSSPVRLVMLRLGASSIVNFAISEAGIGSEGKYPRSFQIAARRLGSGMFTVCAVAVNGSEKHINRNKQKRAGCFVMGASPMWLGT